MRSLQKHLTPQEVGQAQLHEKCGKRCFGTHFYFVQVNRTEQNNCKYLHQILNIDNSDDEYKRIVKNNIKGSAI